MMTTWYRTCCILATLFVIAAAPRVFAADSESDAALRAKIERANAECFACHSDAGMRSPPSPDLDISKLQDMLVEPNVFHGSNHGHMECTQCHGQGVGKYPHAKQVRDEISPCEECHASKVMRIEKQFDASVHAKNLKDKFTCSTCHDPHVALIAAKLDDPRKIVAQDNHMCLACHDSDLKFSEFAPEIKNEKKRRPDIDSIHEWLPNTKLHWQAVRCVECHTPATKTLSHEIVNKEKAEKHCVACHTTDTSLTTRLYRHLAKDEQQKYGFLNSVILSNSYVIGATRHPLLDALVLGLAALTLFGVLVHGVVRIVLAVLRRRKSS
jgi:hypothetical protein